MAATRAVYHLEFRAYRRKFRAPLATAHGVWKFREGVIVRLTDTSGRVGYGECAPVPGFTRETIARDLAWLRRAGDKLNDAQMVRMPARLNCVRWAVECARAMLEDKFPAPVLARLPVTALLPAGRRALAVLPQLARAGFKTFKWKIAVGEPEQELRILPRLIERLPRQGKLRLDANGGLNAREWNVWRHGLAALGDDINAIEFFEQPTAKPPKGSSFVPIALDESVVGFAALKAAHWRGPLVVKPSLVGGLSGFVRWRARTEADLVYSSAFETSVGLHAALALAASDPRAVRALGFGTLGAFDDDGLQLPEHKLRPTINARRIAPEKFSAIWEKLPAKV